MVVHALHGNDRKHKRIVPMKGYKCKKENGKNRVSEPERETCQLL